MLEDTYGHTPYQKMFELADVYGVKFDEERASRKKLKLGIIGAGGVAQSKHLPAIMRLRTIWEPVEVAAVSIRTEAQGRKVSELYGCNWYKDYKEMIRNEHLDGVLVLSSDEAHQEHTLCCLDAGIPVLVEKPIMRSLVKAKQMCEYADQKKHLLMMVSNKRYSPPYLRAKKAIVEGVVANPAMFVGKFNLGYEYVDIFEGGTIHIFDIMRYLMGEVQDVRGVGTRMYAFNKTQYPFDNAIVNCVLKSGAIGSIYTSATALSLKPWERVEVYGCKTWLSVEDQYELTIYDSEIGPSKSYKPVLPNTLLFDEEFGGFMGLIENFLQCIRGVDQPLVTGWDGYKSYELAVASHLAIKNGGTISLPLDAELADKECSLWMKNSKQF